MEVEIHKDLVSTFLESFEIPFTGSVDTWASLYVNIEGNYAVKGSFDVSISKYLIPPFQDLRDKNVQQINLVGATQTAKTLVSEVFIPYVIANDPDSMLKLHQSDEMAKFFTKTRLLPLLFNCKPVKDLLDNDRFSAGQTEVVLPNMAIKIAGAKENVLHGTSVRYLLIDEAWLADPDVIQKAKARTTAFGNNKKILITSQPGIEGDQLDDEMNKGLVYEWSWKCPYCFHNQPWYWSKEKSDSTWAGIVWDKVYSTDSSSSYDYEKTGNSSRLICYYCTGSLDDSYTNRRYLNESGSFMVVKDGGDHKIHTYTWNAFVNQKITFKEKVIQYLQAVSNHKRFGTTDGLRIFRQQVLGQCWRRFQPIETSKVLSTSFNPDEKWPQEIFRCISIDYQRINETKFYIVASFSKNEIRILEHSFCAKWEDIANLQKKWKIPSAAVFVDSGYCASEVYSQCYAHSQPITYGKRIELYGWWAMKGEGGKDTYSHKIGNDTVQKYYKPEQKVALNNNQFARLILWSHDSIKTILFHIRDGKSEIKLSLPTPDPIFDEHLNAESIEWVEDKKTGIKSPKPVTRHDNNHYLDCCAQALAAAFMRGIYSTIAINSENIKSALSGSLSTFKEPTIVQ